MQGSDFAFFALQFRSSFLSLFSHSHTYKLSCQKEEIDNQIDFVMMFISLAKNNEEMKCSFIEMFIRKIESMHIAQRDGTEEEEEVKQVQCIYVE